METRADKRGGQRRFTGLLERTTGLAVHSPAGIGRPLERGDYPWLPVFGVLTGILTAGFYLPLTLLALPSDVALLLALGWQAALMGFRSEHGFWQCLAGSDGVAGEGVARAALLMLLCFLVKYMVLRQFFPEEISRLLLYGCVTAYCVPSVFSAVVARFRAFRGQGGAVVGAGAGIGAVLGSAVLWVLVTVWIAAGGRAPGDIDPRALLVVLAVANIAWLLMADALRVPAGSSPGAYAFCGSLVAETAALTAVLASRYLFPS